MVQDIRGEIYFYPVWTSLNGSQLAKLKKYIPYSSLP